MSSNGYPTSFDKEPNAVQVKKTAEGITTIIMNRSQRRNAIDGPTGKKLTDAFLDFENDHSQKPNLRSRKPDTLVRELRNMNVLKAATLDLLGPPRMQIRKPIISAVSGYAVAGGLELSLLGDIRVAEEDAIFGIFCRRWGVPLIDGGTVRLQAIIGLGRALDMILTGRGVGAQEALAMGLANRVVPKGKALDEATKIARQLVTFPQGCMNADRTSCYYAVYGASSFEDALSFEYNNGIKVIDSESVKGAARFSAGAGRHGKFDFEGKL
ncbi:enoyl- hydratase [Trichoderma arundinaceum]|uniref:Enoyl-hydratase n=1 Tax=Trichoderma arundinaceum TaxID=490622 RepID=A0A395NHW8_TRIAR|nr:enoyl- hydratase [Trichoderma arundinaceum]